jgi:hypothetical protein
LQRRLDYAELLLTVSLSSARVASFDSSVLVGMDVADLAADVRAATEAANTGDAAGLKAIMDRHTVSTEDGLVFYDPQFSRAFASGVSPTKLADALVAMDADPALDLAAHEEFLTDLAGVLSAGVTAMSDTDRRHFMLAWTSVTNDSSYVTVDASRRQIEVPFQTPRLQALSLLVARGDWPGSFLTGVAQGIQTQEADLGAGYWLNAGVGVKDPSLIDPDTGRPLLVTDPMYGVWQAGVQDPAWFTATYMTDSIQVDYIDAGRNDPTNMFDTTSADVSTGLWSLFHRGFDQASYSALMSALATVDFQRIVASQDPIAVEQAQIAAKALLLEDYRNPQLPPWLHTALDALSLVPVVEIPADALSSLLYWLEGDHLNAGISAGAVFIPGLAELPAKGLKWLRAVFKTGSTSDMTGTVWDFIKATQPVHEGTHIPRSFELDLGNGTTIWVSGNATKHFAEEYFGSKNPLNGRIPSHNHPIAEQVVLLSLREILKQATKNGIPYTEKPFVVGDWGIQFRPPREPGQLPSLVHALPNEQ